MQFLKNTTAATAILVLVAGAVGAEEVKPSDSIKLPTTTVTASTQTVPPILLGGTLTATQIALLGLIGLGIIAAVQTN